MDSYLINKYHELSSKYPELCFKFRLIDKNPTISNSFILGIVTNKGPICFKLDSSLFNDFNVKELYENHKFSSYVVDDIDLENLDLENVSYFDIENDTLYNYFGNVEEVIISDVVRVIQNKCFKSNNYIRYVKGNNVEEIYYYAFVNNNNLEKLEFRRIINIGNLFNIPKLKEIIVGDSLSRIDIEDELSEEFKFFVNEHLYTFNYDLDERFLEQANAIKKDGEEISLAMINGNDRRFRFIKEDSHDRYNECFVGVCSFEKLYSILPESLKCILQNYNYSFYILKDFPYSGMCKHNERILIFDMSNISVSFFHEVGHAIDFCFGKISDSDTFKNIYNEEKEFLYANTNSHKMMYMTNKFLNHVIESEEEFFAESFQRYFEKDENFYKECPKAYHFVNNLLYQLDNNLDKVPMEQLGFKK